WYGPTDLFEAVVRDYLQEGRGTVGRVGAALSYLFDAADLTAFAVEWIEERFTDYEPRDFDVASRVADPSDHRGLAALLGELEQETSGSAVSPARLSTQIDELLESADRCVFVAVTERDVVGMIVASVLSPQHGGLDHAFVAPEYRRRGILRELEIEATTYLREHGCSDVELHVGAENGAARAAWRALGYTPTLEYMERPL
ncbi:unnamed protein product, partial [marine sediment metagenome]